MSLMFDAFDVSSPDRYTSDEQPWNMAPMLVTLDVSNPEKSSETIDLQNRNIPLISVVCAFSECGSTRLSKDEQFPNMLCSVREFDMSKLDKSRLVRDSQSENILCIFWILEVFHPDRLSDSKALQPLKK